ncbi:hypothetical protein [Methylobacterium sp. A54F]
MSSVEQAVSGHLVFMPWLHLPCPVRVGGFRFVPVQIGGLASVVDPALAETARQMLRSYVDQGGKPIKTCTVVLRQRHAVPWDVPAALWDKVSRAAQILAVSCLAEQRFFMGHFSAHMNATMFRPVGQGISAGSDGIGLTYLRRGGALRVGGLRFSNAIFQRPPQIEGTECEVVNQRLAKALERAQRSNRPVWDPIAASLELFLLGHAEMPDLGWDNCVMLSAMAFEQLLEPKGQGASVTAETFATLWAPHASKTIAQAKRVRPDPDGSWAAQQQPWPIHRKWMKELFEARNARAHRGRQTKFSANWADWQHMVIAAFVYPLTIKLRLAAVELYELNDEELGACEALDLLLDSDWGQGWRKPPEWPRILSNREQARAWTKIMESAFAKGEARARKRVRRT